MFIHVEEYHLNVNILAEIKLVKLSLHYRYWLRNDKQDFFLPKFEGYYTSTFVYDICLEHCLSDNVHENKMYARSFFFFLIIFFLFTIVVYFCGSLSNNQV